jgi:hypothetical protein
MFNVCPGCGLYSAEKSIDPRAPFMMCPSCGYRHPFVRLPLFILTRTSATASPPSARQRHALASHHLNPPLAHQGCIMVVEAD